jgi:DNA transformation protein
MFGGSGIFKDGTMFALIADETLYLKADEATQRAFVAEGNGNFTYETAKGSRVVMSYWRAPDRLLEDSEELVGWARTAISVAATRAAKHPRAKAINPHPAKRSRRSDLPPTQLLLVCRLRRSYGLAHEGGYLVHEAHPGRLRLALPLWPALGLRYGLGSGFLALRLPPRGFSHRPASLSRTILLAPAPALRPLLVTGSCAAIDP